MAHLHRSPIDAIGSADDGGRPYNGTARQRACILARLKRGPASRGELERECGAPCVTKRVSELRTLGYAICSTWVHGSGPAGTGGNVTTVYALVTPDKRQGELFANGTTETEGAA